MKKLTKKVENKNILFLILIIISTSLFGQEKVIIEGGNYYINPVRNWSEIKTIKEGADEKTKANDSLKGKSYKLKVVEITDNTVYFKFWNFNEGTLERKIFNNENGDKIFNMPLSDFKNMTQVYYNRAEWRVGAFTVPFKLRFDDFNFTANVNLGTSLSLKYRFNRKEENGFMFEPLIAFSATGIDLNENNSSIEDLSEIPSNLLAFSVNSGFILHINNNLNAGIFLGVDNLSNSDQKKVDWKHNGNLWMGIGFNINFSDSNRNDGNDSGN